MEGFWLAGEKGSFLSDGELLQSSCGRNMPFKAKIFRFAAAITACGLPGSSRVPFCGIVGTSSLEMGRFCIG